MIGEWTPFDQFVEGKFPKALRSIYSRPEYERYYQTLNDALPKGKLRHSLRVGANLARAGVVHRDVVDAALFHDFLERGGDIRVAARSLGFSDNTIRLINLLSNDEKFENPYVGNGPLLHLQQSLSDPSIDQETRNNLVLIKISDRIDNLNRRLDAGGISKGYLKKSRDLITWLMQNYRGDPSHLEVLRQRLRDFGLKIKRSPGYPAISTKAG